MNILLSNDDGVHAPGLKAMHQALSRLGKVTVVAPLEEKSTTGHSLTLHKPLRLLTMENGFYGVNGSPADCVYLGIRQVLKKMPDLVVSGINRGANLGQDVYYSGTVSAAREACILGIPAIAVSLAVNYSKLKTRADEERIHFGSAAKMAADLIKSVSDFDFPEHTFLNFNVPDRPLNRIKGTQVVRQGFRYYSGTVLKRRDHRGKDYFWVGGQYQGFKSDLGTDCSVVEDGYASITPVKLDCTDSVYLARLKATFDKKKIKKK